MKRLSDLLGKGSRGPKPEKKADPDEKTAIFLAEKIIGDLYGTRGREQMRPKAFRGGTLYFKVESSLWANELWVNREKILEGVNREYGTEVIRSVKVTEA